MKQLIVLDIDGPLNSGEDHKFLINLHKTGLIPNQMLQDESLLARLKVWPKNVNRIDNYVNVELVNNLHEIINAFDADILFVSSWLVHKQRELVATFLGLDINRCFVASDLSGGAGRCIATAQYVLANNYTHVMVIDDQKCFYDQYGLAPNRLPIVNKGLSDEIVKLALKEGMRPVNYVQLYDALTLAGQPPRLCCD